jgi:molybdenum cofactor synthesis domain-containing protein
MTTSPAPTAALLIIGNEILSGRTVDANLNYIARALAERGIKLIEVRVVADVEAAIIEALHALRTQATYLFTTGGIGPTHDDITAASIAKAFGLPLELNDALAQRARTEMGDRFTPATLKMATFPKGAQLLDSPQNLFPGFRVENVFCLAGIPRVMQTMLHAALPLLATGAPIHSHSLDVLAGESKISAAFADIQDAFPHLDLGSYPFRVDDINGTSLVVRGTDAASVQQAFKAVQHMVESLGLPTR